MKKAIILSLTVFLALDAIAQKITFMPQWTPQSQFAGYYVARDKGFYTEEGLDVDIIHLGASSTESVLDVLKSGTAQIVGQQLLQAIVARADGTPIVNVLQLTQKSGLMCVSREPISKPEDLDGKRIGRWRQGYSEFCDIMEMSTGIYIDWIPFVQGINLYVFGAVDATLCYSFSEYIALQMAMGDIPAEQIIRFSDFGYNVPEDGLYTLDDYYDTNKDVVDKFIRASKRGWDYARTHRDEAVEITYRYIEKGNIVTNLATQKHMLDEYLDLQVNPATGVADYAPAKEEDFNEMVNALIDTGYIYGEVDYNEIYR